MLIAFLLNIFSTVFSIWLTIVSFKKERAMYGLFYALLLFFIIFPCTFDSACMLLGYHYELIDILNEYSSDPGITDYSFLKVKDVWICSFYSFFFVLIFALSSKLFHTLGGAFSFYTKPTFAATDRKLFFPAPVYVILSFAGLIIFGMLYGLDFSSAGFGYRSRVDGAAHIFANFSSLAMLCSLAGLNFEQKWVLFRYIMISIPFVIIAYLTEVRALFVAFFLMIILFFYRRYNKYFFRVVPLLLVFSYFSLCISIVIRTEDFTWPIYPLWRDSSSNYLYYCIHFADLLNGNGEAINRMVITGLPFAEPGEFYDICVKLADIKFFKGWGTIHPTLFGWCFADNGWYSLYYAAIFAFIFFVSDFIMRRMIPAVGMMFVGLQFTFVAIMVRGAVQPAYAQYFYPAVILLFINIMLSCFFTSPQESIDGDNKKISSNLAE